MFINWFPISTFLLFFCWRIEHVCDRMHARRWFEPRTFATRLKVAGVDAKTEQGRGVKTLRDGQLSKQPTQLPRKVNMVIIYWSTALLSTSLTKQEGDRHHWNAEEQLDVPPTRLASAGSDYAGGGDRFTNGGGHMINSFCIHAVY